MNFPSPAGLGRQCDNWIPVNGNGFLRRCGAWATRRMTILNNYDNRPYQVKRCAGCAGELAGRPGREVLSDEEITNDYSKR